MREPVRILSDLHLGHSVSRIDRVELLRPLIAGAGTVIFNGDTWQELSEPWRDKAARMLRELQTICEEEKAESVFLTGNHDPGWQGPGWLALAEGRIIVTHGDCLFAAGSPWKREVFCARKTISRWWRERPEAATDIDARIRLARDLAREYKSLEHPSGRNILARAWDASMPPQRALHMLASWWLRPKAAVQFLRTFFPKAEVLVFGHFHLHHRWESDGRLIIDTGSYLNPGKAHWVEWHNGWLRRGSVIESTDAFRMGEAIDVWRLTE
jgi:predicted phosphodiesterase